MDLLKLESEIHVNPRRVNSLFFAKFGTFPKNSNGKI